MKDMLTIAVSRGRIWDTVQPLLKDLNLAPDPKALASRRIILPTADPRVRLLRVRSQDAPSFVARGAAQAGIAGRDVLAERRPAEIACPLDLQIAKCRMVVATPPGFDIEAAKTLLVATKYPSLARSHFASRGIAADIVKLHGALEIAPQAGVADVIVDLADSGQTLAENGLVETDTILQVSALWIVNRAAARRMPGVSQLQERIAEYVSRNQS